MKLTILTMITNPEQRQDMWIDALDCYLDIADEVIVVDGSKDKEHWNELIVSSLTAAIGNKLKIINLEWPYEWSWEELPKHLNAGLEQCTGDWVIKLDIDQFIHERDKNRLRETLQIADDYYYPTANFTKFTVYNPYKAFKKGLMPVAINRHCKGICFGLAINKETDLCTPILKSGYRKINGYDLPTGNSIELTYPLRMKIFNYDYFFKDLKFSLEEYNRFSRAYKRFYNKEAFTSEDFRNLRLSYTRKYSYDLKLGSHPKYIRNAVKEVIDGKLKVVGNLYV